MGINHLLKWENNISVSNDPNQIVQRPITSPLDFIQSGVRSIRVAADVNYREQIISAYNNNYVASWAITRQLPYWLKSALENQHTLTPAECRNGLMVDLKKGRGFTLGVLPSPTKQPGSLSGWANRIGKDVYAVLYDDRKLLKRPVSKRHARAAQLIVVLWLQSHGVVLKGKNVGANDENNLYNYLFKNI
jgi:hypothetical protein